MTEQEYVKFVMSHPWDPDAQYGDVHHCGIIAEEMAVHRAMFNALWNSSDKNLKATAIEGVQPVLRVTVSAFSPHLRGDSGRLDS